MYDESATAHTLFHKLKFPIESAFTIVYILSTVKKGMSSCEIARQFNIHQETAWFFKRKVQEAMKISPSRKLKDNVEADETFMGGFEPGKPGRSNGKKRAVEICVEVDYSDPASKTGKIIEAKAELIEDCTSASLEGALDKMVEHGSVLTTDGWGGYVSAAHNHWHDVAESNNGENFKLLHWHIFNLKNWLRGIHHHVSGSHLQSYLHEFNYRFNRRNHGNKIVFGLLSVMCSMPEMQYSSLIAL
jgi:transposase-like protein